MSANIFKLDLQEGLEQAWHGLTKVREKITLDDCCLAKWDVKRVPLVIYTNGGMVEGLVEPTNYDILRCTDCEHLVGKPIGQSYGVITNAQFLDMCREAVGRTAHKIKSVGSLRNRGRIFVTFQLDQDTLVKIGKRTFQDYLTAGSSHDQSCELFWANTGTCTVCDNTFTMNLASVRQSVEADESDENGNARLRHSKNAVAKLPGISDIINRAVGLRAEFYAALRTLEKSITTAKRAERIFAAFEASKDAEELATITKRRVNDLMLLFFSGRGNAGSNLLDVFSAITDYYTHSNTGADNQRQWESSEYGVGAARKRMAFKLLTDGAMLQAAEVRGEKLLANTGFAGLE